LAGGPQSWKKVHLFTPLQVGENIEGHLALPSSHSTFPALSALIQVNTAEFLRGCEKPAGKRARALHLANRHSPARVQQHHLDLNWIGRVFLLLLLFGK
jgi:hypothetical protein